MDAERIGTFRRALEDAVAEERVPTAHGTALLCPSLRDVYDLNFVRVDRGAGGLEAEAESALAACFHRKLTSDAQLDVPWPHTVHLVMAHHREPDRLVDTSAVREVDLAVLEPLRAGLTLAEPWGDEEIARDLNEAKRRVTRAVPTRFFAAFDGDRPVAWCELRRGDGVAQIEDVNTLPDAQRRGFGRAVVQHALQEAEGLVFLEALADDWPRELYAKLGFDVVGERNLYLLAPSPLTRVRLRTPRLELRLATIAELHDLFAVASAGIHDPDHMPFAVPWTDDLEEAGFLGYHRDRLESLRPDDWSLELVVFHEGRPVGVQAVYAKDFAETREVGTGSWLGRAWQGRGLGVEMRCAVLAFAFDVLGARRARSGAILGSDASLAVSRKLGYRETGIRSVTPRGVEVDHHDLELEPAEFRRVTEVEVLAPLEHVRELLGAKPAMRRST